MANTTTTNYGWTKPEVGSDTDAWGGHLNTDLDGIDTTVKAVSNVANAALPKAGGTMTGALLLAVGAVGAPGLTFTGDLDNGLYYIGANSWGLAANGAAVLTLAAGAATANGTLTVTGAATFNGAATFASTVATLASSTSAAGINVPHGAAPTSPVNGDVWTTTAGFFVRLNGSTKQMVDTGNALFSIATATLLGNNSGSTGSPSALSASAVKTLLAIANTDVSGLGTASVAATGTSGHALGFLDGDNTHSGTLTFSGATTHAGKITAQAGIDITTPLATMTTTEAGYMGTPVNVQSGNYALVASDRAKCVLFTANATCTIPANSSVAFPQGTAIEIAAASGVTVTVAITTDSLVLLPTGSTGSRTLTGPGTCVIQKLLNTTTWWIKGDVS